MEWLNNSLTCVYPKRTKAVSLTGDWCQLGCAHCGGHYLKSMTPIAEALLTDDKKEVASWLISGGCDGQGRVPLQGYIPILREIKGSKKYNFHLGLADKVDIDAIADIADCVSFDFLTDDFTIQQVYKMNRCAKDYAMVYQYLRSKVKVVPHICLGLLGGKMRGEKEALRQLVKLGADGLVFIVFKPTRNTDYARCQPPAIAEVAEILTLARQCFPQIPISLGCMRPGGRYRELLDNLAVQVGIDCIVQPTPAAMATAEKIGLQLRRTEECCAL